MTCHLERFWSKVDRSASDGGCWLWTANVNNGGYGRFYDADKRGDVYAHRHAYELVVGPIPDGLVIDHTCRVPRCVNPAHLEPVTQAENTLRGRAYIVNSARQQAITHCKRGHEFTPENTSTKSGQRVCLTCHAAAQRRYLARKASAQ